MPERLLVVDDEASLSESLKRVFEREGYDVLTVPDAEAALTLYEEGAFDLIISDILLPGMDGIEFLKAVKKKAPDQIMIVMTAYASIETAVGALRAGAHDYILKPVIHDEIKRLVRLALNERSLRTENLLLKKQIEGCFDFEPILGNSRVIQELIEQVKKIADSRSNVMVLGETGTGKELFTRAIHFNSSRRNKPFIPINCSAIPDTLLESELFGYIKGAFTGASQTKRGLLEEADSGTVFLDEIADLSFSLQAKLLRVIDDYEIRPLGSTNSRKVDIRFVAATNRDIHRAVKEGTLREDLYYRLSVVTFHLPPLRDRKEDIPVLAAQFVIKFGKELAKQAREIAPSAVKLLMDYDWPGNVREFQNVIERAVLLTEGKIILPEHLPEGLRRAETFFSKALSETMSIEEYTKEFIKRYEPTMNEQKLADSLGITRKALWEKRKRWGLAKK